MNKENANLADRISLRPVVLPDEEDFLIELYYTTRDDIQMAAIDEEQKRKLSLMQYQLQKDHYATYYPDSSHDMVLLDDARVGRLWTARYETELLGIDLAILPEYQNLRIGTFLMQNLFEEAKQSKKVFNFHVLKTNFKAIRFYERLNCKFTGETISHFMMQWRADG
ncbi:MAG TPA: GNAT family N-acetyltransferase [Pyrinomonadaceae bacterium]|jgi:ribosomal protein S18 acetylase RimI-like enzyme